MACHYMIESSIALFVMAAGIGAGFGVVWGLLTSRREKPEAVPAHISRK